MPFAKLDSEIIYSSIWSEPLATRCLWITMLAIKDENGFVASSRPGLIRAANISESEFDIAINCLESPDKNSRTIENQGRRVKKIEGGWVVLNHEKYRLREDVKREQTRLRVKRFRENQQHTENVTHNSVTGALPSVSVSESVSESVSGQKKHEVKYLSEIDRAMSDFAEMRRKIRKPLTDRGDELIRKKLESLSPDEKTQVSILEQSIANSWQGVFPLQTAQEARQGTQMRFGRRPATTAEIVAQAQRVRLS